MSLGIKVEDEPRQERIRGDLKACRLDRGGALCRYHPERSLGAFGLTGFEEGMTLEERYEFLFQSVGPVHHL